MKRRTICKIPSDLRCTEHVYVRDTYRRTGRGKTGFEMHYSKERCRRAATRDGRCWQHVGDRL